MKAERKAEKAMAKANGIPSHLRRYGARYGLSVIDLVQIRIQNGEGAAVRCGHRDRKAEAEDIKRMAAGFGAALNLTEEAVS